MKRTINRLFGAALLLAALVCFVFCASAQDAKSGSCGEALQWTLEDGKYKKLGTAKEPAYTAEKLTGGKVYYFKVVAVRKLDSGNLYSADSAIKKVRVK